MIKLDKIGTEIEFSTDEERELQLFLEANASGITYDKLLTRKRSRERLKTENEVIYEYNSPVISSDSYYRFAKYYYFVSKFSSKYYPEGAYDNNSGSMHTHISFINEPDYIKLHKKLLMLIPFMSRNVFNREIKFRDAQDGYAIIRLFTEYLYNETKDYWIGTNSDYGTLEIRLNENIPVWYILVPYLDDITYKQAEEIISYPYNLSNYGNWNSYIQKVIGKACKKSEFKNKIQEDMYVGLTNYLYAMADRIVTGKEYSIKSFYEFFSNYYKFQELEKWYSELDKSNLERRW